MIICIFLLLQNTIFNPKHWLCKCSVNTMNIKGNARQGTFICIVYYGTGIKGVQRAALCRLSLMKWWIISITAAVLSSVWDVLFLLKIASLQSCSPHSPFQTQIHFLTITYQGVIHALITCLCQNVASKWENQMFGYFHSIPRVCLSP